jgi:hypothetical protein
MRTLAIKMTIETENHASRGNVAVVRSAAATRRAAYLGMLAVMFAIGAVVAWARLGRF